MTKISYRKTKAGEWVVYGPAAAVQAHSRVTITKRDGSTKTELIARVGRPFQVGGVAMVYGYLAPKPAARNAGRRGVCDNCGDRSARLTECRDSSGVWGDACPMCAREPWYARSFG